MPRFNDNEKRLLMVMGVGAFLVLNFFGWMAISSAMDGIATAEKKLKTTLRSLENAKVGATEADMKREWIDKNVKTYQSEIQRETHLADLVTGALTSGLDVEIVKNAPMTTLPGEYFIKSRYKFDARGPWNDVMELIYRLQKPTELRFVPRIRLLPRKNELDDSEQYVEASLELEQWWAKPEGVTMADDTAVEVEQPAAETVNPPAADPAKPEASPDAAAPATPSPAPSPLAAPTDTPKPNP